MMVQPVLGQLFTFEINATDIHKGNNSSDSCLAGIVFDIKMIHNIDNHSSTTAGCC
jgi:hypothetical protein